MIFTVKGSHDYESGLSSSVCVDAIPSVNTYRYASSWPRIMGIDRVDYDLDLDPKIAAAAGAIIKVSSWTNGVIKSYSPRIEERTWDEVSIPTEKPSDPIPTGRKTWTGAQEKLPVYNCASLAIFATGCDTLHAVTSPIKWDYTPATTDAMGIIRIVPSGLDPHTTDIADLHWMIGLGRAEDVLTMSSKNCKVANIKPKDHLVMQVHGGDGALLISSAEESYQFWAERSDSPVDLYTANPIVM